MGRGSEIKAPRTPRPLGSAPIAATVALVHPGVDELLELAIGTKHAQSCVLGVGDGTGRVHGAAKHSCQGELGHDRPVQVNEMADSVLRASLDTQLRRPHRASGRCPRLVLAVRRGLGLRLGSAGHHGKHDSPGA